MSDPASLQVSLSFSGMDLKEATSILSSLPETSTTTIEVTKPSLGSARYAVHINNISIKSANTIVTSLLTYCEGLAMREDKHA